MRKCIIEHGLPNSHIINTVLVYILILNESNKTLQLWGDKKYNLRWMAAKLTRQYVLVLT